jgi:hypothetical protein
VSKNLIILIFGIFFGFVLSRVGASNYDMIFSMFTMENLTLAWVILTAIVTAAVGMQVFKLLGHKGYKGIDIKIKKRNSPATQHWAERSSGLAGDVRSLPGNCPGPGWRRKNSGRLYYLGLIAGTLFTLYGLKKVSNNRKPSKYFTNSSIAKPSTRQ